MCETCWANRGGHAIVSETTIKAAELIQAIYDTEDGGAGGHAHIVVDDWGVDDSDIDFCLNNMNSDLCEETNAACLQCLSFMKELSFEERASAMAIQRGYIKLNQG
jgi:hypothetical protein